MSRTDPGEISGVAAIIGIPTGLNPDSPGRSQFHTPCVPTQKLWDHTRVSTILRLVAVVATVLLYHPAPVTAQSIPTLSVTAGSANFICKVTYNSFFPDPPVVTITDDPDCFGNIGSGSDTTLYTPPFWGGKAEFALFNENSEAVITVTGAAATDSDELIFSEDSDSKIEITATKTYLLIVSADTSVSWTVNMQQRINGVFVLSNQFEFTEVGNQDDGFAAANSFQVSILPHVGSDSPLHTFNPTLDPPFDLSTSVFTADTSGNQRKEATFRGARDDIPAFSGSGPEVFTLQVSFRLEAFSNHGCSGSVLCNSFAGGEEAVAFMGWDDVIPTTVGGSDYVLDDNPVSADNLPGRDGGWVIVIGVSANNTAPVADDDTYNATEDTQLTGNVISDGTVDSDVDGDSLTAVLNADVSNGTLVLSANGSFTYDPDADYCGPDSFTYHANDGALDSNVATASITVTCVNDAPSFTKTDPPAVNEDAGAQSGISVASVFDPGPANESGQTVNSYLVSAVTNASLLSAAPTVNTSGQLSYTPAADAFGTVTFGLKVKDSGGTANGGVDDISSPAQTVTITINPVNDAPVATNDSFTKNEDTQLSGNVITKVPADSDVDGDSLQAVKNSDPTNGTLVV